MELTVGAIIEGKVKSITNFGAFIALPENKTGMVHISEVANAYVSDIRQYLTEGQDVKVMVIAAEPGGKINLSIKRLEPKPAQQHRGGFRNDRNDRGDRGDRNERSGDRGDRGGFRNDRNDRGPRPSRPAGRSAAPTQATVAKTSDQIFEERLKQFMSESDSKISSLRQYTDHRTKNRRR